LGSRSTFSGRNRGPLSTQSGPYANRSVPTGLTMEGSDSAALAFPRDGRSKDPHPGGRHCASSQTAQSRESSEACAARPAFLGALGRRRASSQTAQSRESGKACVGRPASRGANGFHLGAVLGAALRARSGVRPRSGSSDGLFRAGNGWRPPLPSLGPARGGLTNSRPGPRGIPPAPDSGQLPFLRPRSQLTRRSPPHTAPSCARAAPPAPSRHPVAGVSRDAGASFIVVVGALLSLSLALRRTSPSKAYP